MKIICVSGKIGTGKTTFCKKLIHITHTTKFHKHYIHYINIDNFVHNIHKKLHTNKQKLQKILFYSGNHHNINTHKTWFFLNKKFKKLIISYIIHTLSQLNKKNNTLKKLVLFDIAIQEYFTTAIHTLAVHKKTKIYINKSDIQYIHLDNTTRNNNLYTKLFLLKKQRNFSFQKTLKILQQQM